MTDLWLWILMCVALIIFGSTFRGYASMTQQEQHRIPVTDLIIANQQRRIRLGRAVTAQRAAAATLIAVGLVGLFASPWVF